MRRRIWILLATTMILQVVLAAPAGAARGVLDPTFGGDGKVMTDFAGGMDIAEDLAVQGDGKIVAAGLAQIGDDGVFGLTRYDQDGSLDPSFGSGGRVTTRFFGSAAALAVQGDGKIVAVGHTGTDSSGLDFALARYEPDGTLDPSFGGDGTVTTDLSGGTDMALDVALQGNGKIVVAGSTSRPSGFRHDFALARYKPDGTLDASFGTGGMVQTHFGYGFDRAHAVVLQWNGRIVVAGEVTGPDREDLDFGLARYNRDGTLDPSFGTGGLVRTDFGGDIDRPKDVALQGNGKILVAGSTTAGSGDFALARYEPDGALDAGFAVGGTVTTDFAGQGDSAFALAVQGNGKTIVAGLAGTGSQDFGLVQYNVDGSLNLRFGRGGKVVTDFAGQPDYAAAVVVTADGKIVAAGNAIIGRHGLDLDIDIALARYG